MIGKTIAHYRVGEKIGAGGMGEVYRARDTKLNRDVALKVLPEEFARDQSRMARFKREAQVLASLNHPNIAAIYGLEQEGDTHALVLELVEGPTLAERIQEGAVPSDEALKIVRQMAEALEAAHDRGIIHRDLKPANVKVKDDGTVKVLDFGLAKALAGEELEDEIGNSPTLSVAATKAGIILGTAAYMSPEQAKGKKADRRADVWAFGVVLFEMLTAQRLYTGETISEVLASVMKDEPDWDQLPQDTPPLIRKLLGRCLEKDPRRRLQAIGEARLSIEGYLADPASSTVVLEPGDLPAPAEAAASAAVQPLWQTVLPWAVAGVMTFVALLVWAPWRAEVAPAPMRLSVNVTTDERLFVNAGPAVVLSPDGTRIAFVAVTPEGRRLFVRSLDKLEANQLSGTENATSPFFSPDGNWIGFFGGGLMKKVSVTGGAPVTLGEVWNAQGGSWSEDGFIYFTPTTSGGIYRVSEAGGPAEEFVPADPDAGEGTLRWPQVLPGGAILYTGASSGGNYDEAHISVFDPASGARKVLHRDGFHARYLPSGHLTYIHEGTLYAAPFDLGRLELAGLPAPAIEGVVAHVGTGGAQYAFSETGTIVYIGGSTVASEVTLHWVDFGGNEQPLLETAEPLTRPHFSPDGRLLAYDLVEGGNRDVWVYDLARGSRTRLTFDPAPDEQAIWTPDSRWVTFNSAREGQRNIYRKRADGTGEVQQLTQTDISPYTDDWTPDGRTLMFHGFASRETQWDLWTIQIEDDGAPGQPQPFLQTAHNEYRARFSPDGRWVAYQSDESGRFELYVRPFTGVEDRPATAGRWQISNNGGWSPEWSRTKHELYYREGSKMMAVTYSVEGDSFRADPPRVLFDGEYLSVITGGPVYSLHSDSKRFVMMKSAAVENPQLTQPIFIQNFFDELRRIAPTGK